MRASRPSRSIGFRLLIAALLLTLLLGVWLFYLGISTSPFATPLATSL